MDFDFARPKCVTCPRDGQCLGQTEDYAIFCEWSRGDNNQREHIKDHTARKLGEPAPVKVVHQRDTEGFYLARSHERSTPVAMGADEPVPMPSGRVIRMATRCPFRERCGCQTPICHDPDFGPRFGTQSGDVCRVTIYQCADCVTNLDRRIAP